MTAQRNEITRKARAKINLGLDITGRRADGYHELRMVMQTIGLADDVTVAKDPEPGIRLTISDGARFLPEEQEQNLAWRAAKMLADEFGDCAEPGRETVGGCGIRITLKKQIPVAAGPVIAFTISSALSGSYNSACTGRAMLLENEPEKQVAVIDSKATGPEQAMLIWRARDLILQGKAFEEIHTIFALASYRNLIKNGRVSRLIGFIAGHLGFWGIGVGDEKGEIAIRGKARGSKSMIRFLVEEISKVDVAGKQILISHCQNEKDALALKVALEAAHAGIEVLVQQTRGLDSFYAERSGLIVGY